MLWVRSVDAKTSALVVPVRHHVEAEEGQWFPSVLVTPGRREQRGI